MAKVSFISPSLVIKKIKGLLNQQAEEETQSMPQVEENQHPKSKTKARKNQNASELEKFLNSQNTDNQEANSQSKLNISAKDLKIVSSALSHYQKYLHAKQQFLHAEEVAEVDKKFAEFLKARENNK
jgi:hypothetical protein